MANDILLNANLETVANQMNAMAEMMHRLNKNWWINIHTGEPVEITGDLIGSKIALCHSELSEALEGARKNLMDDKLPHRKMVEVELADCVIRIFDLAVALGLDLGGAFVEKTVYNTQRADHRIENRLKENGKKF